MYQRTRQQTGPRKQPGKITLVQLGCAALSLTSLLAASSANGIPPTQIARPTAPTPAPDLIRPPSQCPSQLQTLMPLMLRDLPSYANRVNQRAYTNYRTSERPGHVLLAGRPEYEPLSLGPGEYSSATESEVSQVFFTTLERQYFSGQAIQLQHFHWLFLIPTEQGWRFVLMLSSVGSQPADEPPTPPRDSSQGVLAEAIRLWLRDCAAGSVEIDKTTEQ
ncbi:MAG: hypothetical protein ACKO7W_13810 [Elainella sp.]